MKPCWVIIIFGRRCRRRPPERNDGAHQQVSGFGGLAYGGPFGPDHEEQPTLDPPEDQTEISQRIGDFAETVRLSTTARHRLE